MIGYEIIKLRPYFYSIREVKGFISLDLIIPLKWEQNLITDETVSLKLQDNKDDRRLISLISKITTGEDDYKKVFESANKIVKFNLEQEEKEKLFKEKMDELKEIFMNADLDKLKTIKFIQENGQMELAKIGDGEGLEGDRTAQEEDDSGIENPR